MNEHHFCRTLLSKSKPKGQPTFEKKELYCSLVKREELRQPSKWKKKKEQNSELVVKGFFKTDILCLVDMYVGYMVLLFFVWLN